MDSPPGDRERYDPPLARVAWTTTAPLPRDAFLADARARLASAGLDAERIESALAHGGLHLCGVPRLAHELPERIDAASWVRVHAFRREPETPPLPEPLVLLDRDGLVAVAKPAWWPCQATRASRRLGLERVLQERLACPSLRAVHRLDRETSGVALYARDARAAARAGSAFARGAVVRRYLAHVAPAPPEERFEVAGWLARAADPARFRFALHGAPGPGRRASRTRFRRLDVYAGGARVEALPETGRTHQIRVHLAAAGSPVRGDPVYGDAGAAARCLLHAELLALPELGLEIVAPPPADFAAPQGQEMPVPWNGQKQPDPTSTGCTSAQRWNPSRSQQ